MKLNNKRTILVGLAFLSICAFWQMYDNVIPLILTKTFHMNETYSGCRFSARFLTGQARSSASGCRSSCSARAARSF